MRPTSDSKRNEVNTMKEKGNRKYRIIFHRIGARDKIEITEIVEAEDAEVALAEAFRLAEEAKWHVVRIDRV